MIDNYDSFTFNLVHYFRSLGQTVEVYRNNEITLSQIELLSPKFIVLSPGPGTPDDAGISLAVIEHFAGKIPLLGVCLGHQCIAQYFGATVQKAHKVMHGKTSMITHNKAGLFKELNTPLQVTRYHSLIVKPSTLPEMLTVTAWTTDENNDVVEVMALEHTQHAISSVQFHPESILTEQGLEILDNFIQQ